MPFYIVSILLPVVAIVHLVRTGRDMRWIMSAVALLKANPKPTRDEARHALSGNLCRCGAYDNYLNAVMRAAGSGENVSRA